MHNLSLYGAVSQHDHERVLAQLAGITRMQPQYVQQVVLVFKSQVPPGLARVQIRGGTQGVQQQSEMQKLTTMLTSGLYFVHVIGTVAKDGNVRNESFLWTLDFKDTPEAGKQIVSSRLAFKVSINGGDPLDFMRTLGYDHISSYQLEGTRFFDSDIVISLHRARQIPESKRTQIAARGVGELPPSDDLKLFDQSGGYLLHASLDIAEGNNQELRDRGTKQLLILKETLKQAVMLLPGDRLALDTRIPNPARR